MELHHSRQDLNELLILLRAAQNGDSTTGMLAALYGIADVLASQDEKVRAFEILALVTEYPLHTGLRTQIETLYDALEYQICPRAVADAKAQAEAWTLDDLISDLLDQLNT